MIKKLINCLLSLIFPVECLGCKKENTYFCKQCLGKIKPVAEPFKHLLIHLDGVYSAADYNDKLVRTAIHCLKFRFIKQLAEPLAEILINYYSNNRLPDSIIMPVPLNKKRLLERGFNQAELIAKIFAGYFNYQFVNQGVIRHKNTPHQVGLAKKERLVNVREAFRIKDAEMIKDKNIILIDDVVTTGSTLEEIARVLKRAGAKKVWGLTIAKD